MTPHTFDEYQLAAICTFLSGPPMDSSFLILELLQRDSLLAVVIERLLSVIESRAVCQVSTILMSDTVITFRRFYSAEANYEQFSVILWSTSY